LKKIKNEKIPRVHMSVPHQKIIKRKKLSNHSVKRARKKNVIRWHAISVFCYFFFLVRRKVFFILVCVEWRQHEI
jgi:hypothetical protein